MNIMSDRSPEHERDGRTVARFAGILLGAALLPAQTDIEALWKDATFKKHFVAAYGINSEVEPRVTSDEIAILEKLRPIMAEDLPKAELTLKKLMKPDCSAILDFTLGGIQFQQDQMGGALESYGKAVTKFPSFRRAWRNLGLIHVRKGNHDEAIRAFVRMLELGGIDPYAYGLLGFAYAAKQDYQPAEAAYRNALLLQPDNTEWRLGLTRCAFKQEKYEECAALLEVLIARYPDKSEFWLLQAHTFLGMKQPLRAAENLEAVDRLGKAKPEDLYTLAEIYVREGLTELSTGANLRALAADPGQPPVRSLKATEALVSRGAFAEARAVAAAVKQTFVGRLEPGDQRTLAKVEARLALAEGKSDVDTAAVLEEVVKLDPLDGQALLLLGQFHARQDAPDRAVLSYERAANIPAFEAEARLRHGQLLVGLGRYGEALPILRRSQAVRPREDVARYIDQVDRLARAKR